MTLHPTYIEQAVSWRGMTYMLVTCLLLMIYRVAHVWPRDRDGKRLPLAEAIEEINKQPTRPLPDWLLMRVVLFLFMIITMLAAAFTSHSVHDDD